MHDCLSRVNNYDLTMFMILNTMPVLIGSASSVTESVERSILGCEDS